MLTGEVHYLRGLGLRRLTGKGPASAQPLAVSFEHDAHGIVVLQWSGIGLQRRFPLRFVLLVAEAGRKCLPHVVSHLAKGGNATVALPRFNGVSPLGNLSPRTSGLLAGIRKRDAGSATKPHLFRPAAPGEPQNPFAGTGFRNNQIEVATIAVFARLSSFDLSCSEFARHVPAPVWSPSQSPKIPRLRAGENGRCRTTAKDRPMFQGGFTIAGEQ